MATARGIRVAALGYRVPVPHTVHLHAVVARERVGHLPLHRLRGSTGGRARQGSHTCGGATDAHGASARSERGGSPRPAARGLATGGSTLAACPP
eukprot:scaffold26539_cov33-Tisochrysis_lutea.AAC.2